MNTRRQIERGAKQLFRFCIIDGNVDETRVRQIVQNILRSHRRGYLLLLRRFFRLLTYEHANHVAQIECAAPLTSDVSDQLRAQLTSLYGTKLVFVFIKNAALIGGLRIRVKSDVYDGSVRFALMILANHFGFSAVTDSV